MSIWGKIIGGTAGFALGGPIGAIIGIMIVSFQDILSNRFHFAYVSLLVYPQ